MAAAPRVIALGPIEDHVYGVRVTRSHDCVRTHLDLIVSCSRSYSSIIPLTKFLCVKYGEPSEVPELDLDGLNPDSAEGKDKTKA